MFFPWWGLSPRLQHCNKEIPIECTVFSEVKNPKPTSKTCRASDATLYAATQIHKEIKIVYSLPHQKIEPRSPMWQAGTLTTKLTAYSHQNTLNSNPRLNESPGGEHHTTHTDSGTPQPPFLTPAAEGGEPLALGDPPH